VSDSSALNRVRERVGDLEQATSELSDRIDALRTSHEVLQRDVRWILGVSMGAAAVVATLISAAATLL
jgi:hypothetical protein